MARASLASSKKMYAKAQDHEPQLLSTRISCVELGAVDLDPLESLQY